MKVGKWLLMWLLLLGGGFWVKSWAVTIPVEYRVAPLSANRGDGLWGAFWDATESINTLDKAKQWMSNHDPDVVFHSTLVDYPDGNDNIVDDETNLSAFLGGDNPPEQTYTNNLTYSVFLFYGFIAISKDYDQDPSDPDIDVNFAVGSDDGFELIIGEQTITSYEWTRGFGFSTGSASFEAEGLYPVSLIYYENGGYTGIEWYSTIPGGPDSGAPDGYAGIVPTEVLSTSPVPLPGAAWLLGGGLLGLALFRKRSNILKD